jgi:hypothetical protein
MNVPALATSSARRDCTRWWQRRPGSNADNDALGGVQVPPGVLSSTTSAGGAVGRPRDALLRNAATLSTTPSHHDVHPSAVSAARTSSQDPGGADQQPANPEDEQAIRAPRPGTRRDGCMWFSRCIITRPVSNGVHPARRQIARWRPVSEAAGSAGYDADDVPL